MFLFVVPRHALRALFLAVVAAFLLLSTPVPAFAHTRLISSDPGDGTRIDNVPTSISLTFNENMKAEFSAVSVVGPDGANWQVGELSVMGGVVNAPVKPLGPAGRYEVGYRVVSDDGHPVQGKIAFTLVVASSAAAAAAASPTPLQESATTGPDGAPSAAPPPTVASQQAPDDAGTPVWPWLVGVILLAGAGTVVALRLSRNEKDRDSDQ